jgi:hypothetical protein
MSIFYQEVLYQGFEIAGEVQRSPRSGGGHHGDAILSHVDCGLLWSEWDERRQSKRRQSEQRWSERKQDTRRQNRGECARRRDKQEQGQRF